MKTYSRILVLLLAALAFHLPAWVDHWHPTWDSAVYLTLARNLAGGEGYTYEGAPHVKYPPGLPLLLAPFAGPPGSSVLAERGLMIACACGWMLVLYFGLRRRWGEGVAFWTALLAGLNYGVLLHSVAVLSDLPFLVPWTLSLFLGERMVRDPDGRRVAKWLVAFLVAFSFRVVAIVQLPVFALLLWRRFLAAGSLRRSLGLAFALALLVPGAWFLRTDLLRNELPEDLRDMRSYEHEMATGESYVAGADPIGPGRRLEILWGNLDYYRGLFGDAVSGKLFLVKTRTELESTTDVVGWLFGLAVMLLVGWMAVRFYRAGQRWLVLSSLFYLILVVAWPSRQWVRFLLPLYPLIYLSLVCAGRALFARLLRGGRPGFAVAALPLALLGLHAGTLLAGLLAPAGDAARSDWGLIYAREHREPYESPGERLFYAVGDRTAEELPGARVACDSAAWLVYRCGVHARSFPILSRSIPEAERGRILYYKLSEMGITHVIVQSPGLYGWQDLVVPLVAAAGVERVLEGRPGLLRALGGGDVDEGFDPSALVLPLAAFEPQ